MSHACRCGLHVLGGRGSRFDPSGTTSLRNGFVRGMEKRFFAVRKAVRRKLLDENFFGARRKAEPQTLAAAVLVVNAFKFEYDADKLGDFERWLKEEMRKGQLLNSEAGERLATAEGIWADGYIDSAYKLGIQRGTDELRAQGMEGVIDPSLKTPDGFGYSFIAPVHRDDLAGLYLRTYEALNGVSNELAAKISSALAMGFANGQSPWTIARDLARSQEMLLNRAKTIARTEVIRAHHRGLFRQYKASGVAGVSFRVEWLATPDDRVCEECASLSGKVFPLDKMEDAIPKHPNCRCVMIPSREDLTKGTFQVPEEPPETAPEPPKVPVQPKVRVPVPKAPTAPATPPVVKPVAPHVRTVDATALEGGAQHPAAQAVVQELKDIHDRIPGLSKRLTVPGVERKLDVPVVMERGLFQSVDYYGKPVGSLHQGDYMLGQIRLSATSTRGLSGPLRLGGYTVDGSVSGAARHEFGHFVQHSWQYMTEAEKQSFGVGGPIEAWVEIHREYARLLGSYAQTSPMESFAEAFCTYSHRDYKAGMLPKKIEDFMEKLFGKKAAVL